MARAKKTDTNAATPITEDGAPAAADTKKKDTRVIMRVKDPLAWGRLLTTARNEHWRRLQVTIQVREWLLAGKPANLDAATAMLKARGLEDHVEAVADIEDPHLRAQAAERIASDEGLCEFSRRPGHEGIWMPSNNIKAGIKENWSVMGLANQVRGSRKGIAEGVFICCADSWSKPTTERDWIYLGEKPAGVYTAVSHSIGPKGPTSSIKRHEYVIRPVIKYDIYVANALSVSEKISDDELAKALVHFEEHGLGACRSQGFGKFDILEICELATVEAPPETESASAA